MAHCELSGKAPVVKNLVSHSNIKTKSRGSSQHSFQEVFQLSTGALFSI